MLTALYTHLNGRLTELNSSASPTNMLQSSDGLQAPQSVPISDEHYRQHFKMKNYNVVFDRGHVLTTASDETDCCISITVVTKVTDFGLS